MNKPKYVYGTHRFDDGVRPVLMKRGTKYYTAICVDSNWLFKRHIPFCDERYFKEIANSDDNLAKIKVVARFLKGRSKLTGLKREMTKAIKTILKEMLAYEVQTTHKPVSGN